MIMFSHWVNLFFGLDIYYPSETEINSGYVIYHKYITPLGLKNEGILKGNELLRRRPFGSKECVKDIPLGKCL